MPDKRFIKIFMLTIALFYIITSVCTAGQGEINTSLQVIRAEVLEARFEIQINTSDTFTFQFQDTSRGSPTEWFWTFGDGINSTEQNPVHKFENYGTYRINMSITKGILKNSTSSLLTLNPPQITTTTGGGGGGPYGYELSLSPQAEAGEILIIWSDDRRSYLIIQSGSQLVNCSGRILNADENTIYITRINNDPLNINTELPFYTFTISPLCAAFETEIPFTIIFENQDEWNILIKNTNSWNISHYNQDTEEWIEFETYMDENTRSFSTNIIETGTYSLNFETISQEEYQKKIRTLYVTTELIPVITFLILILFIIIILGGLIVVLQIKH